jgi:hypothetical protein
MSHNGIPTLIVLFCLLAAAEATAQPQLVYETTAIEFGEIWEGEELQVAFPVRNGGDAPLRLKGG